LDDSPRDKEDTGDCGDQGISTGNEEEEEV
jgi:hypothetical protein